MHHGGVYLDTDVELKANLDVFLEHEAFSGFEAKGFPFTAVWGSIPYHSMTTKVLDYYDARHFEEGQESNTKFISKILINNFNIDPDQNKLQVGFDGKNTIHIYPKETFCLDLRPNYATHHFEGSWLEGVNRLYKDSLQRTYYIEQFLADKADNLSVLRLLSKNLTATDLLKMLCYKIYPSRSMRVLRRFISRFIK